MDVERRRRPPLWLRHLEMVRGEQKGTIDVKASATRQLDLAMMLMAEGLAQLKKRARQGSKRKRLDRLAVDRQLRRFAALDQQWVRRTRS
ncbi:MAG: hypothetical protein HY347_03240 [candidate division NC10 bacterium]|nr:hypothetical protein [candidate division NC10 bacterium]